MERKLVFIYICMLLLLLMLPVTIGAEDKLEVSFHKEKETTIKLLDTKQRFKRYTFHTGYTFEYPDAVRGIYVTGNSVGGAHFDSLVNFVDKTELNTMVIDIKDDFGNLTFTPEKGSKYESIGTDYIENPEKMMKILEEKQIYPIARVVVFKDTHLAKERPDLSFLDNGEVWVNGRGEAFVSPYQKEVWDYNIEIAKLAAEMGFKEIQFDYVRFPEGFETRDEQLEYGLGDYENSKTDSIQRRVEAVTDFVEYARKELEYYDVDIAVDIFGYAATIPETPGIGQNFSKISENVDVISSMIYPSHWGDGNFGIPKPDKEPYRLVNEYAKVENEVLGKLDAPPVSRPWLQDFSAPWIYSGEPTFQYGKKEIEDQIKALKENGIEEFLLWNAGNSYTQKVNYTP